ncbi:hypothetical protein AWB92_10375 [Mycobacterium sp. IEC1808]|uniref:NAD(P)H-binding protein n=1 Tax=Mycobacterium sp. IEC1808 TaxID=1743230 RepID=UPI000A16A41A|nr:NAD(P)H-binding protein [Mycobacterium sp. IEC1808]ORW94718.1 hypothetical protein AWB92_10375 [Mycobacterium sp. IEC1808]
MTHNPILVTGATGRVGRHLVTQLAAAGHPVRALIRDPSKAATFPPSVEAVVADLTEPRSLTAAFDRAERVFVLAPTPPIPDMEQLEINAFVAAEQAGARHIVYLSNFGAGRFHHPLFTAHGANEWRLRSLAVEWTILRPTRFMTEVPFTWHGIHTEATLREPVGGQPLTIVDPHDIAAAAALILTTDGHASRIYELTGQAITGPQIAEHLSATLNRPIGFEDCTEDVFDRDLAEGGVPAAVIEILHEVFRTVRQGHWYGTPTLANLLGRPPRSYADWLRDNRELLPADREALK